MTGATFSSTHYQEYKETGNKNIFEEVIEKMVLEGVAGMNESTLRAIKDMPKDKKRMAILRLLMQSSSSHIQMFQKIKGLVNKDISRLEHISDIISLLRDYVEVGDVEKEKFGEVMTPLKLVTDMLSNLPKEIWSNPNLKICDPSNGTGIYPMVAIHALMKGLKNWEPNEEKRYRHIVENMIYACELQPKNTFLYLCAIDPFDQYAVNVYTGSFLDEGFDFHMKNVWGLDRFDIVMANPPYNGEKSKSKNTATIYPNFLTKSMSFCDEVIMITPARWFDSAKLKKFREFILGSGRLYEVIFYNSDKLFDDTLIRGGISVIHVKGSVDLPKIRQAGSENASELNIMDGIILNPTQSSLVDSLVSHLKKKDVEYFMNSFFKRNSHIQTNDSRIKEYGDVVCLTTSGKKFIDSSDIDIKKSFLGKYKVAIPLASSPNTGVEKTYILGPNEVATSSYVLFLFETELECESFSSFITTKLCKYLVSVRRPTQSLTSNSFSWIPMVKFDQIWNDEKINKHFVLENRWSNLYN